MEGSSGEDNKEILDLLYDKGNLSVTHDPKEVGEQATLIVTAKIPKQLSLVDRNNEMMELTSVIGSFLVDKGINIDDGDYEVKVKLNPNGEGEIKIDFGKNKSISTEK
jgi:hypothetical protein